jgi:hypothetical protein
MEINVASLLHALGSQPSNLCTQLTYISYDLSAIIKADEDRPTGRGQPKWLRLNQAKSHYAVIGRFDGNGIPKTYISAA